MNVLIADDEKEIVQLLRLYLESKELQIFEANDGEAAWHILIEQRIDLVIVDLMMPRVNGYDLIKKIRSRGDVQVMIISAKTGLNDRILGYEIGADDYITKPFEPLEVAAKVRTRLARIKLAAAQSVLTAGNLTLDTKTYIVYKDGEEVLLTKAEIMVLILFMRNPGQVFTKEQIYEAGWGTVNAVDDNTIRVIISRLRDKIGDDSIKTIRGLGYRMVQLE